MIPEDIDLSDRNARANQQYHDYVAKKYERDPRVFLGTLHSNCGRRLSWLKQKYDIKKDSVVLNLGVGTGNLMRESEALFRMTIGMDISINMLEQAKRYSERLVQADARLIPLRSDSVDLVYCVALLHHIYGFEKFFSSIYRVMKPGGIFYSDYDQNRRLYQTIRKVPFLPGLLALYKKTSDKFIFTRQDKKEWKAVHDMAEYHEEISGGLDPAEIADIAKKTGFSKVEWICHSDGPDLGHPQKGRWQHGFLDILLTPFSRDYNCRAKLFSIIAVK